MPREDVPDTSGDVLAEARAAWAPLLAGAPRVRTGFRASGSRAVVGDTPSGTALEVAEVLRALDVRLFTADGWFAIDVANVRVPGVALGALDDALALVGRGRVATIVGRLRREVCAVDVDLAGDLGHMATDTITAWCTHRGLWHLVRPSGGSRGRAHVVLVPGVHREALTGFIAGLRAELHVGPRQIDVRQQIRPLSAPHRRHGPTPPPAGLASALQALGGVLAPLPDRITARRRLAVAPVVSIAGPREPLVAAGRTRRDLPGPWAAYLERGRASARAVDRDPGTRSQIELEATFQLVICGYTEPQAWEAITRAHPTAFVKARDHGRRWWWHTWNRCVIDADTWLAQHRAQRPASAPQDATTRLRAHLEVAWLTWPVRTRHTDYEVATVLVDHMDRHDATAVPIAQRELLMMCAVTSRTTIRASLDRLFAAGLFEVEATYVPGTCDTSHTIRLAAQFTRPEPEHHGGAVRVNGPHAFQPPQPAPALPLRQALGLAVTHVLTHLPPVGSASACSPGEVAYRAGLLRAGSQVASGSEVRTVRAHLRTLAEYGLAAVDEVGRWRASAAATAPAAVRRRTLETVGRAMTSRKVAAVTLERSGFRAVVDVEERRRAWARTRDAALARAAKAQRGRQMGWWDGLSAVQQDQRRTVCSGRFAVLSPAEQAGRKQLLAASRARAGVVESERYETWLKETPAAALEQRSIEHAFAYAARPAHEQIQLVAGWAEHRARWRLPHHTRGPGAERPPLPEEFLLHRTMPDLEELALFDADTTQRAARRAG